MAGKRPSKPKPTKPAAADNSVYACGADSMLRCYNSTEWRLEDWFGGDEEPQPRSNPDQRKQRSRR